MTDLGLDNPFLRTVGPRAQGEQPRDVRLAGWGQAYQQAAMQHAQDAATSMALRNALAAQAQDNLESTANVGAALLVKTGKQLVTNWMASSAGPTISTATATATNEGAALATLLSQSEIGATQAATSVAGSTLSQVAGVAGPVLGVASTLYGSYQGIEQGLKSASDINRVIRQNPNMPESKVDDLRQKAFNRQMVSSGTGAASGALGGLSYGPVGAVIGGILGGAGGALGASRTYKDSRHPAKDTAMALGRFMRNPFKK